jgi:glycosyltransferase involved in cell wall biosynthesis
VGGGTRVKILEALAAGKAVVSTTLGGEGLAVQPGEHLLVGDDADGFAEQVVRVLDDAPLRRRLGEAGRALVVEHYTWSAAAAELSTQLRRLAPATEPPARSD